VPNSIPTSTPGSLRLGHAADSQLRWVLVDVATLVEEARVERDLSPLAAIGLGQMMAAAAMLTRLTAKRPLRMLLEAGGDGPLGRVRAEADTLGHLRGLVANRLASNDPSPDAVDSSAGTPQLGVGMLRVVRHSDRRNYESKVALVPGGVARNVANYLAASEQIQSAVLLGVQATNNGIVAGGGLIVQAMPDADPRVIRALETRLSSLPGASRVLAEEGPAGLLKQTLGELPYETLHEAPLTLSCDCDRERFRDHIRTLARTQPDVVEAFEVTRVQCSFCGADYVFEPVELAPTVN
jgi:molecular chaperone Hsp33